MALRMITEKQLQYIELLNSPESTREETSTIISSHIEKMNKKVITDLNVEEGSSLIQELLKIPTQYKFLCGKIKSINRLDFNRYNLIGELEACLHECEKDFNQCDELKKHLDH